MPGKFQLSVAILNVNENTSRVKKWGSAFMKEKSHDGEWADQDVDIADYRGDC